jgi:uncharacterized protein RhaS with RHS repeats
MNTENCAYTMPDNPYRLDGIKGTFDTCRYDYELNRAKLAWKRAGRQLEDASYDKRVGKMTEEQWFACRDAEVAARQAMGAAEHAMHQHRSTTNCRRAHLPPALWG